MSQLIYLLPYREMTRRYGQEASPSVFDNMNILHPYEANKIADYMDSGMPILEFMGMTEDPLTGQWDVPHYIRTDGKFAWDGVLARWVRAHKVRLPQDFLDYADCDQDVLVKRHEEASDQAKMVDKFRDKIIRRTP
ncbi:hypothetical protein [Rhizobium lusitanum]|uniref:Uncharacterized protein n=1 Tax=Rhizobium lusitanum TaxID=293958 RepID=A0A7X0IXZ7_9HYPH|nr:hypothetical protein [Rhizobium lusitanum]MBB6487816.1 hypothetical protein [Rhizobium lusitanum]